MKIDEILEELKKGGEIDYDASRNINRYNARTGEEGIGARKQQKDGKGGALSGKAALNQDATRTKKKQKAEPGKTLSREEIATLYPDKPISDMKKREPRTLLSEDVKPEPTKRSSKIRFSSNGQWEMPAPHSK